MKMAKASEKDIDAAGDAMSVLNDISSGYYPARDGDEAPLRKLLAQFYLAFSEAEELETCVCGRCMCVY